jgi:hypothetical protein
MAKDIIDTLNEGVELASYFQKELNNSTDNNEKRKQIKYLGQCLGALMEQISDYKQRREREESDKP